MTDYKDSKWASEIIELQKDDGSWGYFHTLSNPSKRNPITTEQAIRRLDIANFYHVSLVADLLDDKIALALMDYILQNQSGIYYIYDKQLSILPQTFKSKEASRYISAVELLSEYRNPGCKEKLMFVVEWLIINKEHEGYWDMETKAKDGVKFPLSDSWRKKELRIKDCTYRISKLIKNIRN